MYMCVYYCIYTEAQIQVIWLYFFFICSIIIVYTDYYSPFNFFFYYSWTWKSKKANIYIFTDTYTVTKKKIEMFQMKPYILMVKTRFLWNYSFVSFYYWRIYFLFIYFFFPIFFFSFLNCLIFIYIFLSSSFSFVHAQTQMFIKKWNKKVQRKLILHNKKCHL